jgi:CIC family chloride channel protein
MRVPIPDAPLLRFSLLAILTGLVAGVGAIVFRGLIALFHNLFFLGKFSLLYDSSIHTPASPWGIWIVLVPVLGALLVAFLVKNFAPEAKGHGVPEVIDAIYYRQGAIRPVVSVVKSIASAISIGTGAAVGREGPIIQIGAAFGSTAGQLLHLPLWQRMALIGCGAGGGIAATFNTPIGGLLFAIELILPEISSRTLIPTALATGAATFVGRLAFGNNPAFDIPPLIMQHGVEFSLTRMTAHLCFGLLLGIVSMTFTRSIYAFEDFFDRLPGNYYTRHATGMLASAILMYLFFRYTGHYYVEGVGYSTIQEILNGPSVVPLFMLVLFAAKLLATSLALGSGASGGIFSPSLFMGATLGAAYASLINHFLPEASLGVSSTAMIGMAGVVAGATGAVITAIVIIFEMTRDYTIIIPVMVVASVAYGVRRGLLRDSIYTLKLSRRNHPIPEGLHTNLYLMNTAANALDVPMLRRAFDDPTPIDRLLRRYLTVPHVMAVRDNRVVGILGNSTLRLLDRKLPLAKAFASNADSNFLVVRADQSMLDVFLLLRDGVEDIAVVTKSGILENADEVLGILTWEQVEMTNSLPVQLRERRNKSVLPV